MTSRIKTKAITKGSQALPNHTSAFIPEAQPWLISYFSVTVMKHCDQSNFQKEEFILAYSPRGLESIMERRAW